jgi:hypothetical protein
VSTLADKLQEASNAKKESNIEKWLKSLEEDDRTAVWAALKDEKSWKTYGLLTFLRENGARFDKATFVPFRKGVLAGSITEETVHGSK